MKKSNTKIFLFWLGDEKIDKSKYEHVGFDLVIGPTADEHKYLMSKYTYYRTSFECKKFSFCSDVWRLYKLSNERGLYVDASVIIGPNFNAFVKKVESLNVAVFRGNYKYIETGVMWSGCTNNDFYKKLLENFCSYESIATFIMPVFLSKQIFEMGFNFGWDKEQIGKIAIFPLTEIRNKNMIWKTGGGSWGAFANNDNYFEKVNNNDSWTEWEKKFINKEIDYGWQNSCVERAMKGEWLDIERLREYYDIGLKGITRKQLLADYKASHHRKKFDELIIWSKLYVFFTFKWFKKHS